MDASPDEPCAKCAAYEIALAKAEADLEIRTRDYSITAERLGQARKAIKRYKEQRDDARVRVQLLVNAGRGRQ